MFSDFTIYWYKNFDIFCILHLTFTSKSGNISKHLKIAYALVAQLDRVTGYEPVGQGFESLPARQNSDFICLSFFYFVNISAKKCTVLKIRC